MTSPLPPPTAEEAEILALQALAWIAGDERLGPRLLSLTGLDVASLRARAGLRDSLVAVLDFLAAHEADFIACARAMEVDPARLSSAHRALSLP